MSSDEDLAEILQPRPYKKFWCDTGIYKDEGFTLFEFGLLEFMRAYPGKQLTLIHLHVGYFHFDIGMLLE